MMTQLIYMSRPFGFDGAMLAGILTQSRRNNRRDGITGALICRHDIYLQFVEGDAPMIDALFARIRRDDRHLGVVPLWRGTDETRLFPGWDMLDDPARSWLWSPEQVANNIVEAAPPASVRAVFDRLAGELASEKRID